jgi:hypothetical protein
MGWGSRIAVAGGLAAVLLAGCYGGAVSPGGAATPDGAATPPGATSTSSALPSPTTGYCGMVPEPVPCVDRAGDEPMPTSVGEVRDVAGTCTTTFSADRCQALAFEAATQLGVGFDQVLAVDVVPNPSPEQIDFAHRTFLSVALVDGSRHDVVISCPGIAGAYDPPCMAVPVVPLSYPRGSDGGGGYTDTPEDALPFPSLDPAAVAGARPLRVASLLVPITATGPHSILVGTALLPNGYLAEGDFSLADPWPSDVLLNGVNLEVRPTAGGDPLRNLYEHGWHPGVEEVAATITFDVAWFEPVATLPIVNIVVR